MPDILADIGTKVGSEIKNLDIRLSSAETAIVNLGGQQPPPTGDFTIEPVTWTNLSEINLSGEKILNGDFGDLTETYFLGTPTIGMKVEILRDPTSNTFSWATPSKNPYVVTSVTSTGINVESSDGSSGFLDFEYRAGTTSNFWQAYIYGLNNWSVSSSIQLNQNKLAQGIIKGDGGAVSVQQMFSNPIASGTKLVAKVTRADTNEDGIVRLSTLRANATPYGEYKNVPYADGFVEFETTETTYGIRLSTAHGTREVSSISLFQGVVSGGSVQTHTGGSIEKISGSGGYNAGASSVQKIDGQKDGYVQFQIGHATSSVKIGLVNQDSDYEVDNPWKMNFGGGNVDMASPFIADHTPYENGDWFRIRHYSTSNEIHFQKRQIVYSQNLDFVIETATGSNYNYSSANRPLVVALDGTGNLTIGQLYKIHSVRSTDQAVYLRDLDGNAKGWHGTATRGNRWQVVESVGEDYVTFYTHPSLSNGSDLYVDTSFHSVGARLNDVQIAYK